MIMISNPCANSTGAVLRTAVRILSGLKHERVAQESEIDGVLPRARLQQSMGGESDAVIHQHEAVCRRQRVVALEQLRLRLSKCGD